MTAEHVAVRRLTLLRLERRYFNMTFPLAMMSVDVCNSLGLDELLFAIAPATELGLGSYASNRGRRKAQVQQARRCLATALYQCISQCISVSV